jgi:K+-sensing histidine kinase KdpD
MENGPITPGSAQRCHRSGSQDAEAGGEQPNAPGAYDAFAVENRARTTATGEGVGLSIVKRLCELLDASLELQTTPGKGTTFRVMFPLRYTEKII